jgi:hypothetical protein
MSNNISLTNLTEIIYAARDQVVAEGTGFIQGAVTNGGINGVSTGGTVTSLRTTKPTLLTSYTPAMVAPDAADITTSTESLTINKVAGSQIPLKGEAFLQLANTVGFDYALRQMIAQAIRIVRNQIESDTAVALKNASSRATGTAGTTPFASNINTIAQVRQILKDNGAPVEDGNLSLVINTAAGTNLRNISNLYKANEAGTDATLRRGELLNLHNFSIRESAQVASHTKGTGTSYVLNGAIAVGDTNVPIKTGSGTVLAGDVITYASDSTNKYIVKTGVSAAGTPVINYPGILVSGADGDAVTIGNSYTANIAFHQSAVEIAMRPPALPPGGDMGDHTQVTDDKTGLSFDVGLYKGRGMNMIEIFCLYGVKVWKPEFVATLLG